MAGSLNSLGHRLRELGRHEEALAAAEEAVGLRRGLAAERPDAFAPKLAGSLNNLANVLSELGRREEALAAAEEAVRMLGPRFLALPGAFSGWMRTMLGNYFQRCRECEREPDMELLAPILPYFTPAGADAEEQGPDSAT